MFGGRVHGTYSKTKLVWKVKEGVLFKFWRDKVMNKYELLVIAHIQKLSEETFSLGRV